MNVYGLKKCSTCQKALEFMAGKKVNVVFHDHVESPPTHKQIAAWSVAVGGWEKLINRAGYTWRGLAAEKIKDLTEAKAVELAHANTSLIRRPLIEHADGAVTVGFSDKVKARF